MINTVVIGKRAQKDLRRVPAQVREKLAAWALDVQSRGLAEVRKIAGYHDEPLKAPRNGQRSIRLSLQWRAIYVMGKDGAIEFIEIIEVTPHKY